MEKYADLIVLGGYALALSGIGLWITRRKVDVRPPEQTEIWPKADERRAANAPADRRRHVPVPH